MQVETGNVVVWEDAQRVLDPASIEEALEKHRRGDAGTEHASVRSRAFNNPPFGERSGFQSGHVDRNGRRFGIMTDFESEPIETHVFLHV